jgi:superfamily II DNA or RNA helicase
MYFPYLRARQFELIALRELSAEPQFKSHVIPVLEPVFGEGLDISALECLFIVYPFAFEGKLVQYIGRIQRSGKPPVIFDYRDAKIDYFEKMFKQRNRYYNKLRK